jgi:hypothetical protein
MLHTVTTGDEMNQFKVNDKVAWKMQDRNTMAGTVVGVSYGTLAVRRVDGTVCTVLTSIVKPATDEDFQLAREFFQWKAGR